MRADYSRVTHPCAALLGTEVPFALDLHVLGLPPAFVLSQDQTLQFDLLFLSHELTFTASHFFLISTNDLRLWVYLCFDELLGTCVTRVQLGSHFCLLSNADKSTW